MLVLDANILVSAVLGSRVLFLLRKYAGHLEFLAPDTAFQEAREHIPLILERRRVPVAPAMATLDLVAGLVQTVESETYTRLEDLARQRIGRRDEDDSWRRRSHWVVRFGPKTPTSSAAAWPPGRPTAWSCTWKRLRPEFWPDRGTQLSSQNARSS